MRAPRLRLISVEIAARVECRDLRRALSAVGGAHRTAWTSEIDTTRVTKIRDSRSSDVQRDMLTDCGSRGVVSEYSMVSLHTTAGSRVEDGTRATGDAAHRPRAGY